ARGRGVCDEMKAADRLISWSEARSQVDSGRGTFIGESLPGNGPWRLWWTSEEIPVEAHIHVISWGRNFQTCQNTARSLSGAVLFLPIQIPEPRDLSILKVRSGSQR